MEHGVVLENLVEGDLRIELKPLTTLRVFWYLVVFGPDTFLTHSVRPLGGDEEPLLEVLPTTPRHTWQSVDL